LKRTQQSREAVVNRGTLAWGVSSVEYYTLHPSPAQWVAIAVMPQTSSVEGTSRMVVGTGASEYAAVEELSARLAHLLPVVETPPQPSDWFGD
jgi:hypothetical protein